MADAQTQPTTGELIRSWYDQGFSQEEIAELLELQGAMNQLEAAEAKLTKTLEDPIVIEAAKIAERHKRKAELGRHLASYLLGVLFWGSLLWLIFIRPFTG